MYGIIVFLYCAFCSRLPVIYFIPITIITITAIIIPITCNVPIIVPAKSVISVGTSVSFGLKSSGFIIPDCEEPAGKRRSLYGERICPGGAGGKRPVRAQQRPAAG